MISFYGTFVAFSDATCCFLTPFFRRFFPSLICENSRSLFSPGVFFQVRIGKPNVPHHSWFDGGNDRNGENINPTSGVFKDCRILQREEVEDCRIPRQRLHGNEYCNRYWSHDKRRDCKIFVCPVSLSYSLACRSEPTIEDLKSVRDQFPSFKLLFLLSLFMSNTERFVLTFESP